jgi:hypothetical protein
MMEISCCMLWSDGKGYVKEMQINRIIFCFIGLCSAQLPCPSYKGLDGRKCKFNWIVVGRVWWEKKDPHATEIEKGEIN